MPLAFPLDVPLEALLAPTLAGHPAAALGFLAAAAVGVSNSLHCFGMCGPLACVPMGQTGPRAAVAGAYHGARVLGYSAIGAALGASGANLASLVGPGAQKALPWLLVVALVASALDATKQLGRLPWIGQRLQRLSARVTRAGARSGPVVHALAVGGITPLLPCGLLYAVYAAAAAAGSAAGGAAVMAGFALGGAPALLGAQLGSRFLSRLPRPVAIAVRRAVPLLAAGVIAWRMLARPACH